MVYEERPEPKSSPRMRRADSATRQAAGLAARTTPPPSTAGTPPRSLWSLIGECRAGTSLRFAQLSPTCIL